MSIQVLMLMLELMATIHAILLRPPKECMILVVKSETDMYVVDYMKQVRFPVSVPPPEAFVVQPGHVAAIMIYPGTPALLFCKVPYEGLNAKNPFESYCQVYDVKSKTWSKLNLGYIQHRGPVFRFDAIRERVARVVLCSPNIQEVFMGFVIEEKITSSQKPARIVFAAFRTNEKGDYRNTELQHYDNDYFMERGGDLLVERDPIKNGCAFIRSINNDGDPIILMQYVHSVEQGYWRLQVARGYIKSSPYPKFKMIRYVGWAEADKDGKILGSHIFYLIKGLKDGQERLGCGSTGVGSLKPKYPEFYNDPLRSDFNFINMNTQVGFFQDEPFLRNRTSLLLGNITVSNCSFIPQETLGKNFFFPREYREAQVFQLIYDMYETPTTTASTTTPTTMETTTLALTTSTASVDKCGFKVAYWLIAQMLTK